MMTARQSSTLAIAVRTAADIYTDIYFLYFHWLGLSDVTQRKHGACTILRNDLSDLFFNIYTFEIIDVDGMS